MMARPPKETLGLDMPFVEALERYVGVDPEEMHANIKRSKTKKPPGGKKRSAPSGSSAQNVVDLRDRRQKRHNGR
jgi:hypothetical protein